MSKLFKSATVATVLLIAGLQVAANAQPRDGDRSDDHREAVCKVLQINCT